VQIFFAMKRLQQLMLFANIGLLLFGLGILGYGLYSRFGDDFFISILHYGKLWDCSTLLLITAGLLAGGSLFRLLQPVASVFKSKRVVLTVVIITVVACVSALALIIFVFGVYYEPKEYAVKSFTEQIKHNYGQRSDDKKNSGVSPATSAIDKIQEKYKCCGAKGYTDWLGSEWSLQTGLRVPKSCCNTTDYKACQDKSGSVSTIFQQNCSKELEDWAAKNIPLIGGLGCVQFVLVIGSGILTAIIMKQVFS